MDRWSAPVCQVNGCGRRLVSGSPSQSISTCREQNAPFYGPQTSQVIAGFRRRDGFELDGNPDADRVADLAVRRKLDQLTPNAWSEAEATAF
ncbi:hypothetical protein H6F90_07935 [Trichocoleus sp. FACHB-591]|nr:hypothetical protein [Trichocoleus sp. FACHB-591]